MAYTFNPTASEWALLSQIRQRESSGNYAAIGPVTSTGAATGAYQFMDSTWQLAAQNTGVGTQYASAADAPQSVQDTNALWLLRRYGPNATISWAASGPYDTSLSTAPLIDVTGTAAAMSTTDIMSELDALFGGFSTDMSPSAGMIALGVAAAVGLYFLVAS